MIIKAQKTFFLILLTAVIIVSCTKDVGKPAVLPTAPAVDSCVTNVTYAGDIKQIVDTYCAIQGGCHVPNQQNSFQTYSDFKPHSSLGIQRVKNGQMPPSYSPGPKTLSSCEIAKLQTWVDAGSPDN